MSPPNLRQALEENLFDNDYKYDNCSMIPVIVNSVVKVKLKNPVTKTCRRCRPRNVTLAFIYLVAVVDL